MRAYGEITRHLGEFESISLQEMDAHRLLDRSERKYVLHVGKLLQVLDLAREDYRVLEINKTRLLEYNTEYFDTVDNAMYLAHHSGKQNRFKVRKREYVISGEQFLEVKRKMHGGLTQKKRIELNGSELTKSETHNLVDIVTPYKFEGLEMKLLNTFQRITLVNKTQEERVTIDIGLQFKNEKGLINLNSVAIIEIKWNKLNAGKSFEQIMKKLHIRGSSVSKYCIGRALLEPRLKANLFQHKLRYLIKLNTLSHDQKPDSKKEVKE